MWSYYNNHIINFRDYDLFFSLPFDAYDWAKNRISFLIQKIELIKKDGYQVSPGKIWSIKKLLALDYYIASTHAIFKKNFDNWYFVDTHCGSGLIGFEDELLKDEKFPGSPLIATLRNETNPFSDYFISDSSEESINVLKDRLVKLKDYVGGRSYTPETRSFSETASFVKNKAGWGKVFLIFIDPTGYTDLKWEDIEKLLSIEKADIFINFMSYSVALNRPNALKHEEAAKNFDNVFGTGEWRKCTNQDELVSLYMRQIRTKKEFVEEIPIFRAGENKLYRLIFASSNPKGAGNVMTYIKGIIDNVTTELIKEALKVATNKKNDLDKWF